MKKLKILLFMLCSFILFTTTTKAAEKPYLLDWETAKETDVFLTSNIPFNNGYVIYSFNDGESIIAYYDKDGKQINEDTLDGLILTMDSEDGYLYGFYYSYDNNVYAIKYDSNLNEVKEKKVTEHIKLPPEFHYLGYRIIGITDKVATIGLDGNKITVIDKDLTNVTSVEMNEANIKKYAPKLANLMNLVENETEMILIPIADYKNSQIVFAANKNTCKPEHEENVSPIGMAADLSKSKQVLPASSSSFDFECLSTSLRLYDENYKIIWEKELDKYAIISNVKFVGDYIIASAVKKDTEYTDLLVYDRDGKLIQTISNDTTYHQIEETPKGFIVTQYTCSITNILEDVLSAHGSFDEPADKSLQGDINITRTAAPKRCKTNHQVYYLYHKISTKVTNGKGKIEVIGEQKVGEPVTFKVTPEKGYVLSKVLVTDANGKTVVFTNNVFTMPNADVTIEAIFVKESIIPINPDTGVLPTIIISIGTLASFALLLYFNKKYQFLK